MKDSVRLLNANSHHAMYSTQLFSNLLIQNELLEFIRTEESLNTLEWKNHCYELHHVNWPSGTVFLREMQNITILVEIKADQVSMNKKL